MININTTEEGKESLPGFLYLTRELYLAAHPSLMQVVDQFEDDSTEQDVDTIKSNRNQFPVGYKLVKDDKEKNGKKGEIDINNSDEKSESKEKNLSSSKSMKKPKWLKT